MWGDEPQSVRLPSSISLLPTNVENMSGDMPPTHDTRCPQHSPLTHCRPGTSICYPKHTHPFGHSVFGWNPVCHVAGSLLKYSRQEQSKWLINIVHDICDPAFLRGSLLVWNVGVQQWRLVIRTRLPHQPTSMTSQLESLSACRRRTGKSITTARRDM